MKEQTQPQTSGVLTGSFEIRFESIGGLGANLAAKMLAEAGVLGLGLNGSQFSAYGSEKKGTPVKAFIRFVPPDRELRTTSPVVAPDVIAVFHEGLLKTVDVTAGLKRGGIFLINTTRSPEEVQAELRLPAGTVIGVVDALNIAVEEKSRVNTAMLGVVVRACDFLDPRVVHDVIRQTFEQKYPHLVEANLRTFDRGYREVELYEVPGDAAPVKESPSEEMLAGAPRWGYLNAPIGGVILDPGNTIRKDLSASRQGFLPAFDREICIDCGMCDLVCPDYCFVWGEDVDDKGKTRMVLQGIDYQYCKGCMRCVVACPTGALAKEREEPGYAEAHRVVRFPGSGSRDEG